MTLELPPGIEPRAPITRAHDGRTMIGHVVICQDADEEGERAAAVWQDNTMGVSGGAWVIPAAQLNADPAVARRLLDLCVQRSVTAWDPSEATALLMALEQVAAVEKRDWAGTAVTLPVVLSEIGAIRSAYDKRIAEEKHAKRNIVVPEWQVDIPDPLPGGAEELRVYAGLARQPASPAVQEALLTASLLRWCVQRWEENTTVLRRRDYLQQAFGPTSTLPPSWEAQLADAYAQRNRARTF